jgi:hypothetical protein
MNPLRFLRITAILVAAFTVAPTFFCRVNDGVGDIILCDYPLFKGPLIWLGLIFNFWLTTMFVAITATIALWRAVAAVGSPGKIKLQASLLYAFSMLGFAWLYHHRLLLYWLGDCG